MNKRSSSKSSLFLMELIISLLFFSIAGAVCVQLFLKSHLVGENTVDTTNSILWSQNLAEAFLASNGSPQKLNVIFPEGTAAENSFSLYFDGDWESCAPDTAVYQAQLLLFDEADRPLSFKAEDSSPNDGQMLRAEIQTGTVDFARIFYRLEVKHYQQKGGASHA